MTDYYIFARCSKDAGIKEHISSPLRAYNTNPEAFKKLYAKMSQVIAEHSQIRMVFNERDNQNTERGNGPF